MGALFGIIRAAIAYFAEENLALALSRVLRAIEAYANILEGIPDVADAANPEIEAEEEATEGENELATEEEEPVEELEEFLDAGDETDIAGEEGQEEAESDEDEQTDEDDEDDEVQDEEEDQGDADPEGEDEDAPNNLEQESEEVEEVDLEPEAEYNDSGILLDEGDDLDEQLQKLFDLDSESGEEVQELDEDNLISGDGLSDEATDLSADLSDFVTEEANLLPFDAALLIGDTEIFAEADSLMSADFPDLSDPNLEGGGL